MKTQTKLKLSPEEKGLMIFIFSLSIIVSVLLALLFDGIKFWLLLGSLIVWAFFWLILFPKFFKARRK
jgi:hypothetical protein